MADTRKQAQPRKRSKTELRIIRLRLVRWWDRLKDECQYLEDAIRDAPEGTFTDDEHYDALLGLGQLAWDGLVNHRPKLPARARGEGISRG